MRPHRSACTAYWTGLAGRDAWRFSANVETTALFDAGGVSLDGFLARFDGGDTLGGGSGQSSAWNIRMTPSKSDAVAWGDRVSAARCNDDVTATALVRGAPG